MEIVPTSVSKHPSASSVLVVDDERASGELVATLLRSQGFQVHLASSGRECLEILARGGVDLLILDLMMSKLDGVEVCSHVRHELGDPFLPIIITTSLHDRESRIRAKEAGADDVLVKPLDGLELLVRVDSLLRARAAAASLLRERERLHEELQQARGQRESLERAAALVEVAGDAMSKVLDDQWHEVELARRQWNHHRVPGEQVQRFAELTIELRRYVECLTGTGTLAKMPPDVEATREAADARELATHHK